MTKPFAIDYLLWQVIAADLVDFLKEHEANSPAHYEAKRIEREVVWLASIVDEGKLRPDEFKSLVHSGIQQSAERVARSLVCYGEDARALRIGVGQLIWDCVEVNPYLANTFARPVLVRCQDCMSVVSNGSCDCMPY